MAVLTVKSAKRILEANMLFRTVYGPEIKAIYKYISDSSELTRDAIRRTFLMDRAQSSQSVDDALAFLLSAGLIKQKKKTFVSQSLSSTSFRIRLLERLRQLEQGLQDPHHSLDPLYMLLLTQLFIEPSALYLKDVHGAANQLDRVKEQGGLSQEKIRAWERVMSFLGLGHRVSGGFLCSYEPQLLIEILQDWGEERGILQYFLEHQLGCLLPYAQANGDLAKAVKQPLLYLQKRSCLEMFPMQDSPTKAYFGDSRYKGLTWGGNGA